MYHFGHHVAVVQGLQHVDEVEALFARHGGKTALLQLCYQKYFIFFGIIDYLVQPNDVGMLKSLEHFEFRKDAVITIFTLSDSFLHEVGFVHFFDGISEFSFLVLPKVNSGKAPLS